MILETRVKPGHQNKEVEFEEGYFISLDNLVILCRDFMADCHDGFVSNDRSYIESKLKEMK